MSYGHRAKRDRAKLLARYIMFEDLEHKALENNRDNMVTNAYAQIDEVIHRGNRLEQSIEIDFAKRHEVYETHAYCMGSEPKKDSRLYQSSKK
eukprot:1926744-Heterocapsa_arctica.AAC.1